MRKNALLFRVLSLAALLVQTSFAATVKDSEYQGLLDRATGNAPTGSSFDRVIDSQFNRSDDAATVFTVNQEAAEAQNRVNASLQEQALIDAQFPKKAIEPVGVKDKGMIEESKDTASAAKESRLTSWEEAYQGDLQKQEEKKRQAEQAAKEGMPCEGEDCPKPEGESGEGRHNPFLPPSLANNPFYFSDSKTDRYEQNKILIHARLVQAGFEQTDANTILMNSSGPEEIILVLMQEHGYTYGEAKDIVSSS